MKKIIFSLIVLVFTITILQAQHPEKRMHGQQRNGKSHMAHQQLNLSEEQKNKLKSLNEEFRKNMTELKKKDDITVKEWKTRMADLKKQHNSNLQNVFTPEQKSQMEKMKLERKQMAEIDAKARMEKMNLYLGLS